MAAMTFRWLQWHFRALAMPFGAMQQQSGRVRMLFRCAKWDRQPLRMPFHAAEWQYHEETMSFRCSQRHVQCTKWSLLFSRCAERPIEPLMVLWERHRRP